MTDNPPKKIESPCIRHCCLDDNDICVGCYRSLTEITGWMSAPDTEKLEVLQRCEQRKLAREKPSL